MKVTCISDTHLTRPELPPADILVHAGDLCVSGSEDEFKEGLEWLGLQPHQTKLYVPGNHDRYAMDFIDTAKYLCQKHGITMLVDEGRTIKGIRFYGSPWTRTWGNTQAFMVDEDLLTAKFATIPACDFLITHSPPMGIFDYVDGELVGSPGLRDKVADIKPLVHIFGHVHSGHSGRMEFEHLDKKKTLFANVCAVKGSIKKGSQQPVSSPELTVNLQWRARAKPNTRGYFESDLYVAGKE